MTSDDLLEAQRVVRRAPIGEQIVEAILDLVRAARPGEGDPELAKGIGWGPGPRAAQALMLAARARALVDGRLSPSLDDIESLAEPALKHRMALTFAARADGETIPAVIERLVGKDPSMTGQTGQRRPGRNDRFPVDPPGSRGPLGAAAEPDRRGAQRRADCSAWCSWPTEGGFGGDLLAVQPVRLRRTFL